MAQILMSDASLAISALLRGNEAKKVRRDELRGNEVKVRANLVNVRANLAKVESLDSNKVVVMHVYPYSLVN